jgi:hypothetical protein
MDEDAANRASQEIKALCRRLDPANGSHKDRIRRLNKFRNFVSGEGVSKVLLVLVLVLMVMMLVLVLVVQ